MTKDYEILTEEYRGDLLDLIHEGYIAVVDENDRVIASYGNPDAFVYFRSASKPVQALPVISRNLDRKYGISEEESVIFSGSHLGEPFHIAALKSIFKKSGIDPDLMIMKPTVPGSSEANEERILNRLPKSKLYHNCSGKHASLLILQKELDPENIGDYWRPESKAQQEVLSTIALMTRCPRDKVIVGTDGCGVPVFAVPVKGIASAFKNLACPDLIEDERTRLGAERYVPLIHKYPHMMRGTGYLCSLINHDPDLVGKGGANGVYGIGLKRERIGIAFKIKDGTEAIWPLMIREIFRQIGYHNTETEKMLDSLNDGTIFNDNGINVGTCRTVFKLSMQQ
jgi:L-asparaginase II